MHAVGKTGPQAGIQSRMFLTLFLRKFSISADKFGYLNLPVSMDRQVFRCFLDFWDSRTMSTADLISRHSIRFSVLIFFLPHKIIPGLDTSSTPGRFRPYDFMVHRKGLVDSFHNNGVTLAPGHSY